MAYTDHEIGRVVETLETLNLFDNTLVIWVCGDNGMSAEGSMNGTPNEVAYFNGVAFTVEQMLPLIPVWGTDLTYNHFAVPWAFAMDTPYRWVKQVASHLGGTRTGAVMTWPNRIKDAGGIRHQFHHVIDIVPTIFDAIGIPQPTMVNGIAQRPWDGVSMVYSWDKAGADAPSTRRTQYFEILGNRAIYHDGWMANTIPPVTPWEGVNGAPPVDVLNGFKWELFNLKDDPTQTNDLAQQEPERLKQMQELWMIEAVRNNVLPLNASQVAVLTVERPGPAAGRKQFVYTTPMTSNQTSVAPSILNRPGRHTIVFDWKTDPEGMPVGRGGMGTLSVNGKQVAQQSLPHTQPFIWAWDETFDVGLDTGTPVDDSDYSVPFAFTGKLEKITFDLGDTLMTPEAIKAMMEELAKKRDR
jgi:arylsulfatase